MCYETGFTISMVTSGLTRDFQHYKTALFLSKFMWIFQDIFFIFGTTNMWKEQFYIFTKEILEYLNAAPFIILILLKNIFFH